MPDQLTQPATSEEPVSARRLRPLPDEIHLLFVGPEEPAWSRLTLQLGAAGCTRPRFRWCSRLAAALELVLQERFDCIVIDDTARAAMAETTPDHPITTGVLMLRAGGCEDPVLLVSDRVDDDWQALVAGMDCELLTTRHGWRSPAMVAWIRRSMQMQADGADECPPRRAAGLEPMTDAVELGRLIELRRQVVDRMKSGTAGRGTPTVQDRTAYLRLLRSAVVSPASWTSESGSSLLERLAFCGCTATDVLDLHVSAVGELLDGLGRRSAAHVLQRADLVGLEVLARYDGLPSRRVAG